MHGSTSTSLALAAAAACLAWAFALPAAAETYEVGPGMAYEAVGEVPWESLSAGDTVRIHHRSEPYREKWVINAQGTEGEPIVVQGVPGAGGELPVIDGRDATTRSELNYWNEQRGVIKIGGSSTPSDGLPSWIVIEGLEIRSARPAYSYTSASGSSESYADNAASIYVEKAEHLTIRDCVLHDSGNGLFIGVFDGMTRDVLIEGNHIYDNGIADSIYEHNSYTAAIGITFQHNHYGPLREGALGNNLKDRSAGLVVRYNWIEDGNRQLDLVDGEDSAAVSGAESYDETFVYGNVLVEGDGEGNRQIVHYGGDSSDTSIYRKGTLHFFNNTVVSTRSGRSQLLRLSTDDESADVRNNVVWVTAGGDQLALLGDHGTAQLSHNFLPSGWNDSFSGSFSGTLDDDGTTVTASAPGFADAAGGDFHLAAGSSCVDAGTDLAPAVLPDHALERQYVVHRSSEPRPTVGALDLGAFERCEGAECEAGGDDAGVPAADGGPGPGDDAGPSTGDDGGPGPRGDDGGPAADGGATGGDGDGGCGCRTASGGAGGALPLLGLALLALLRRRSRR